MKCNNIKCRYYKKPSKRDWFVKFIGVKRKTGECSYGYYKLSSKNGNRK